MCVGDITPKVGMLLPAQLRRHLIPACHLPSRPPLGAASEASSKGGVMPKPKLKDYSRIRSGPVTTETHALDKFHDVFEDMQACVCDVCVCVCVFVCDACMCGMCTCDMCTRRFRNHSDAHAAAPSPLCP